MVLPWKALREGCKAAVWSSGLAFFFHLMSNRLFGRFFLGSRLGQVCRAFSKKQTGDRDCSGKSVKRWNGLR